MKIEGQAWGQSSYVKAQTVETKQAGKFSDVLAAQPRQDTLTISSRSPVEDELSVQAKTVTASEPLPADVVQAKLREAVYPGGLLSLFYREVADGKADRAISETAVVMDMLQPSDSSAVQIKLKELREAAANADYTGMSYKEIYNAIWDRYNVAFDGNMPAITTFAGCGFQWNAVSYQFLTEVEFMVEFPMNREIRRDTGLEPGDKGYAEYCDSKYDGCGWLYSMPGYDGMNVAETEQAILKKYAGKDTLLDFLNMQGELNRSGVLGHKMGGKALSQYLWAIEDQVKHAYFPDNVLTNAPISQLQWNRALYGRFDVHVFAAGLKEHMQHLTFSGFDFDVAGAVNKGIDDLLAALEQRDAT